MWGGRSKKSSRKNTSKTFGDVTLNDFANASVSKSRLKKSTTNVGLHTKQEMEDDQDWEEKAQLFDGDFDFVEQENEDGTTSVVARKVEPRKRHRSTSSQKPESAGGRDYPLDVWFLISEYIGPEDVCRFAGICRTSFAVVCSAKFWFGLYKRHYKSVPNLPERLQPECMVRLYGLKSCVIRSLFYMYPPYVERIKSVTSFDGDPHNLVGRQCLLMWFKKEREKWFFYFKLKCQDSRLLNRGRETSRKPDLIEMLEDVSANQDEGCQVLLITCLQFISIPPVLGFSLNSVSLTLSQGFRYHRLQLVFNTGVAQVNVDTCTTVVFDPVSNIRVLDWWHPMYPHSSPLAYLLYQEQC